MNSVSGSCVRLGGPQAATRLKSLLEATFSVALALLIAVMCSLPAVAQRTRVAPEAASGWYAKTAARAEKYMVAAANPLAVEAGLQMLRQGGTAVDAAIATQLVLNLVEPQSSGIGGGAFLLHWDQSTATLKTYDGREAAPASAVPDRFLQSGRHRPFDRMVKSGLSVGVPGLIRLLEATHGQHGRLPWKVLFEPAIKLATEGFRVSPRLNFLLAWASRPDSFAPAARAYFYDVSGTARPVGHLLRNTEFARTLTQIANHGANAFYSGPIATSIVEAVRSAPNYQGDLTLADLAGYRVIQRQPVCIRYRETRVCGMGPPSSGATTVGQILKLSERFDLSGAALPKNQNAPRLVNAIKPMNSYALHILGEAGRLAYADRNRYIADPDFVSVPTAALLTPGYLTSRSALINPRRAATSVVAGQPGGASSAQFGADATRESVGTSHISVVDADGNAVSMTTTIESAFGSGIWAAGFLLNNELTDFSFSDADRRGRPIANRAEGGKRPRSSMAPTILFSADGKFRAALGSPGGSRIILYVVKAVVAMVDWGLDPQSAVALANFGHRGQAFEIEYDPSLATTSVFQPWSTVPSVWRGIRLRALGHRVRPDLMTSGLHIVEKRGGILYGGADPRREGVARGE